MANLIQATVTNVSGNPLSTDLSQAFLTSGIIMQDATVASSPTAVTKITYFSGPFSNVEYYVTETVTALIALANTGTTSMVQVTVYEIGGQSQKSTLQYGFPASGIVLRTVTDTPILTILTCAGVDYGVSETEGDIVTAANVGGGGGGGWELTGTTTLTGDVVIAGGGNREEFSTTDGTTTGSVTVSKSTDATAISWIKNDNSDGTALTFGSDAVLYSLGTGTLKYGGDYSANFTSRSLVDKAYVDGVIPDSSGFALLAGRAGGQTLIGGTAATDDLILRTTAGVGASGATMLFQGGNNGATQFAKVDNDGLWNFGAGDPSTLHRLTVRQPTDGAAYYGIRVYANNGTTYSDFGYGELAFNGGGLIRTNAGSISITPSGGNFFVTTGNTFIGGSTTPTARLHLAAGTATASTAPLKFIAGTNLTTPELGAMEYVDDGTTGHLYFTYKVATVTTRREFTLT